MTPDELQELDSYLAQHIMGWEPDTPHPHTWNWLGKDERGFYNAYTYGEWHPSSNPAQALEVAEKIVLKTHAYLETAITYLVNGKNRYWARFCSQEERGSTSEESLPLAVSLAAKAWHASQQENL